MTDQIPEEDRKFLPAADERARLDALLGQDGYTVEVTRPDPLTVLLRLRIWSSRVRRPTAFDYALWPSAARSHVRSAWGQLIAGVASRIRNAGAA